MPGASNPSQLIRDPFQAVKDFVTGTYFVEEVGAAYAVGVKDGGLFWGGDLCGKEASCFVGVDGLPAGGVTLGHTVLFREEVPTQGLVGHGFQHVYDIETFGGLPFCSTYLIEDLIRHWTVGGDIFWGVRAYKVGGRGEDYRVPTGFGDDSGFDSELSGEWIGSWSG